MEQQSVKVLFLLNSLHFGGGEKHVVSLLNGLDTDKFQLSLAYLKDKTTLLPQLDQLRLTRIFHAGIRKKLDLAAARRIAETIDELEIDVIVSTNEYPLIYSFLARRFARRKPAMMEVFHSAHMKTLKDKLMLLFLAPLFRLQHKLVYVCQAQRDSWRRKGLRARQDLVIHNGIDTDYFDDTWSDTDKSSLREQYGFSDEDFLVGICAALRPEKAHGDLLQAVAKLKAQGIPAKCLIIGDGGERAAIERTITELGLADDVRISGFLADVRPLIAACDVMTLVSHAETFSISALESMSMGKPIVMSDIGGAREQVIENDTGYLFPAGNIQRLVDALKQLVDKPHCQRLGKQSRARVVEFFSEQVMLARFEQELASIG